MYVCSFISYTIERAIPLTLPKFCPLCGKEGMATLIPQSGSRIFVSLKGTCSVHRFNFVCGYNKSIVCTWIHFICSCNEYGIHVDAYINSDLTCGKSA